MKEELMEGLAGVVNELAEELANAAKLRVNTLKDVELTKLWKLTGQGDRSMMVFDERDTCSLYSASSSCNDKKNEIWFIYPEYEIPILVDREKPYIVSGWADEGHFFYSCCGAHETDPEYMAVRTTKDKIDEIRAKFEKAGYEKIIYGREVDIEKTSRLLHEVQRIAKARSAEEFLKLPIEEQRKRLETIL